MARFPRNPVPLWLAGMLVWGAISLAVLLRYRAIGGQVRELNELWLLMSLLWVQFGCAALFAEWRQGGHRFRPLLLRTLLPPLVLHLAVFGTL